MIKYIIVGSMAGLLIYYQLYKKNVLKDAATQTVAPVAPVAPVATNTVTPPNETNLPDFITVEKTDTIEPPRRTTSFASFFKVF
jgi:hypothetical protein